MISDKLKDSSEQNPDEDPGQQIYVFGYERMQALFETGVASAESVQHLIGAVTAVTTEEAPTFHGLNLWFEVQPIGGRTPTPFRELPTENGHDLFLYTNPGPGSGVRVNHPLGYFEKGPVGVDYVDYRIEEVTEDSVRRPEGEYEVIEGMFIDPNGNIPKIRKMYNCRSRFVEKQSAVKIATESEVQRVLEVIVAAVAYNDAQFAADTESTKPDELR